MSPLPSSDAAKKRMEAQRSRDTRLEVAVRSELHRRGLRFRVHKRPIPSLRREADIVFRTERVAVFVDGCFWHGCLEHATWPKANAEFWRSKIERNRERDKETVVRLMEEAWQPVRIWEHEDLATAAGRIERIVRERRRQQVGNS